jgi:folate-binding protein YgfZ
MSAHYAARLTGRGVVALRPAVGAPDGAATAKAFLHGLVTADMDELSPGAAAAAALLTPQGKIAFEFIIHARPDGEYLLDTPAGIAAELQKRLMFYRLRAKIDIAQRPDLAVIAVWGDPGRAEAAPDAPGAVADPRWPALGWRAIVAAGEVEAILGRFALADMAAFEAHRIGLGVAELSRDYQPGEVFPHEANLDQLHGVAFGKGCYVGQEVVSRMHHRGTIRSRFVPVTIAGPAPEPGTPVEIAGKASGAMGSSAGAAGIALLRLDRLADTLVDGRLPDGAVRSGEATLIPLRPAWATFAWPGEDRAG